LRRNVHENLAPTAAGPERRASSPAAKASASPEALEREIAELRETNRRYRSMIERMAEGLAVVDTEERFVFCNPAAERLFGVKPGELVGRNLREFLSAEDFVRIRKETELRRRGIESSYELEITALDGRKRVLSVIAVPWLDSDLRITGAFATFRDVTAQRNAERELAKAESRQSLARMAAAVSHNLNNLLAGLSARCQLLIDSTSDEKARREASAILRTVMRAEELVRSLQKAVLGRDETPTAVLLRESLAPVLAEARRACGERTRSTGATFKFVCKIPQTAPVIATADGIREVIRNIIGNALEAMPKGGTLEIGAREGGGTVSLWVRDTGVGMDEETLRCAFEPFFTTKSTVGAGLGLPTVSRAMTQWGGSVSIRSEPGKGTTVILNFRKARGGTSPDPNQPKKTEAIS